jgi:hypothetical protein
VQGRRGEWRADELASELLRLDRDAAYAAGDGSGTPAHPDLAARAADLRQQSALAGDQATLAGQRAVLAAARAAVVFDQVAAMATWQVGLHAAGDPVAAAMTVLLGRPLIPEGPFSPRSLVRDMVARKNKLDEPLLRLLAKDPDEGVRLAIAGHKKAPDSLLRQMLGDSWDHINEVIQERLRELEPENDQRGEERA